MRIECPSCHYERIVSSDKIPVGTVTAACPRCGNEFEILPPTPPASTTRQDGARSTSELGKLYEAMARHFENRTVLIFGIDDTSDARLTRIKRKRSFFDIQNTRLFSRWYWNYEGNEFVKIQGERFVSFQSSGCRETFQIINRISLAENISQLAPIREYQLGANPYTGALIGGLVGGPIGALTGVNIANEQPKETHNNFRCDLKDGRSLDISSSHDQYLEIIYLNMSDIEEGNKAKVAHLTEEIAKLSAFLEQGTITTKDFVILKQKLLGSLGE